MEYRNTTAYDEERNGGCCKEMDKRKGCRSRTLRLLLSDPLLKLSHNTPRDALLRRDSIDDVLHVGFGNGVCKKMRNRVRRGNQSLQKTSKYAGEGIEKTGTRGTARGCSLQHFT